ncbi:MBL fold metallo-hydrolase [Rhodocytophaga rosea]|uniref:MBL fold metallo-hydrolase n=1 Tax=Rhodocytophaga rosea TaxID=2704465 RepID=A0A6C0GU71_9BACT|nr:MBL fold metallo-hydrolase [Rhodocytophaga rosea]QHT71748.1 MBL fold metallo-hydrolase [Rhodocytophaga rosea]
MASASYICITCGTQFSPSLTPPNSCPICEDERQYLPVGGQQWTSLQKLRNSHKNCFLKKEEDLYGIGTVPEFGIGQRALLVRTPSGNLLWDCISLLDEATLDIIAGLGGLAAIAISHPHYYTTMVEWSQAFGNIPIYLHEDDRSYVMRADKCIEYWQGETLQILTELTLIRCGGHFQGGVVLHWPAGAAGKGVLLTGDIIQVVADRKHVSFMYSYPNLIPLSASKVKKIVSAVEPFTYDRIYGAWWRRSTIEKNAKTALQRSAERYLQYIKD